MAQQKRPRIAAWPFVMALFLLGSASRGIQHILIVNSQVIGIIFYHGPILVVFAIAFLEGNTQGVPPILLSGCAPGR